MGCMAGSGETAPVVRIVHAKWCGAFGLGFFWHHAVVLVREGGASIDSIDPEAPELGAFDASRTTCVHWSAGGQVSGWGFRPPAFL